MGTTLSTVMDISPEESERRREEALRKQRRDLILQHGILIPPAFGLIGTPSQKGTGPGLSIQHRLMEASAVTNEPVSYMQYLQETDLSTCLLTDHLRPGFSLAAQTDDATMLRVGVVPNPSRSTDVPPASAVSLLSNLYFLERKLFLDENVLRPSMTVQLRGTGGHGSSTNVSNAPSLSSSWHASPNLTLFASASTEGKGWCGGHWDKTIYLSDTKSEPLESPTAVRDHEPRPYEGLDTMCRRTVNGKLGAWAPVQWSAPLTLLGHQPVHGYAALNLLGATAALHASVVPSTSAVSTTSYFSMNINDGDQPPLQISLEQRHQANTEPRSMVSLSQVVAFDRWQLNPLEERAPNIRNTIAWTIRMESSVQSAVDAVGIEDSGTNAADSRNEQRVSRVSLGAAWQLNRGLAIKAVVHPQEQRFTTAILLKHWSHPRVACSLLHSWTYGSSNVSATFLGVGVELETGTLETDPDAYYYNHHPSRATLALPNCNGLPQTRATLPRKLQERRSDASM